MTLIGRGIAKLIVIPTMILCATALCAGVEGDPGGRIQPFNYDGVQLLDGPLKAQFEQVRDFYMALRDNDILKGFREREGKLAPGKEIGGAYSARPLSFGQWLSGFARMYKVTGNTAIRNKATYLMDEWGKTISDDGSFYYSTKSDASHYIYEKFVGGLVDMYEYIGSEDALTYLAKITDWAERELDRSKPFAGPAGEWYTLSENLYRAYELTGEKRYYNFARVWEYTDYWGIFARGESPFQAILKTNPRHESYHAYSHVNTLSSAAMAYRVTGEQRYLDTIVNAYTFLKNTQLYATGGYGPEEQFVVPDGMPETILGFQRGDSNGDVKFHFETSCGSWAAFKLSRYLQTSTGEARYGDWIERLVYNGVGAMIPMNKDGMIMYGSKYHLYGAQKSLFTVWFCCQGSLPMAVTDYHNLIYYHDPENLYVNLFVPSKVEWRSPNGLVTVIQETLFPEDGVVKIHVKPRRPGHFGLKFRVPQWATKGVDVQLDNEPLEIKTIPGQWAAIERHWDSEATVRLEFDLAPRFEPLVGNASPIAILRGPVVMVAATARDCEGAVPTESDLRLPADWILSQDYKLTYPSGSSRIVPVNRAIKLHTNQVMRPFYDIRAGEYYRMYFERPRGVRILAKELSFHGDWQRDGALFLAQEPGSYFETAFKGSTLVWEGLRHLDSGKAMVRIDGNVVAEVDQYGYTDVHVGRLDQREVPFRWSISDLGSGEHTIRVTVLAHKNANSQGTKINVSGLQVYP